MSSLIFPNNLVSAVNFQDLSSRFSAHDVAFAKLNIGDEIAQCKLKNLARFKSITAGETITVEQKFKTAVKVSPNVRQLYTTNNLPTFEDGNIEAIFDRLNIVLFNVSIPGEKRNRDLVQKLLAEKDIIISMSLNLFAKVYQNNGVFSEPESVKAFKKTFTMDTSACELFLNEKIAFDSNSKGLSSRDLYLRFCQFCSDVDLPPQSRTIFRENLLRKFKEVEYKRVRLDAENNVMAFTKLSYVGNDEP